MRPFQVGDFRVWLDEGDQNAMSKSAIRQEAKREIERAVEEAVEELAPEPVYYECPWPCCDCFLPGDCE